MSWSTSTQAQVAARLARPDLGRWLGQVQQVRHCAHPVRLAGTSHTIDPTTGEVLGCYDSAAEPDGVTYVRCGNRRASVCPSCSHEYKGDVWHVLMAGAAGGIKNVPDDGGGASVGVRHLHRTLVRTGAHREEAGPAGQPPLHPPHPATAASSARTAGRCGA